MKKILVGIITTFSFLQIQPHSSINSMINGGFKDKLSKEQTQIINQLPSTRLTAAKAFSGAHQLYSSSSGSLLAKQEIDKLTPAPAPAPATTYDGTITLTDNFLLMNGSFDRVTSNTNPIVNGNVKISSYGNITNMDDVDIDGDGTLTKNDNDDTLGTKEVIIEGNVVITGEFKLNGSGTSANIDLIVKGNLTVNGCSTDIEYPPSYIETDRSASITVEGDILFDGKNLRRSVLLGPISTTTDSGTITIQNNKGTKGHNPYGVSVHGKLSTINGDIIIQNNKGFSTNSGIQLIFTGSPSEISSETGTIAFYENGPISNSGGTIKTSGLGNIIFESNYTNTAINTPSIRLGSNSITKTEGSGNIIIRDNKAGGNPVLSSDNSTLEATGSGKIIISDNVSNTNNCIENNSTSTIRTVNGNISFDNNEAGSSNAAILNEGTIETTAAGNISFANNENIDNNSGTIQTTGTGSICASDNGTVNWGSLSIPSPCYKGIITFADRIELNAGSFDRTTQNTNPIVSNGFVKISSNGNITNMADENIDGNAFLTKNPNDGTLGTGEVVIEGNVEITGQFKLTNSPLTIKGNLTVIAGTTDSTNLYIWSGIGSPITVEGDILFDGSNSKRASLQEDLSTTTNNGIITIQNGLGDNGGMGLFGVSISKKVSSINGNIVFQNNRGFSANYGINMMNIGKPSEISSVNGTITFEGNSSLLNPSSLIQTSGSGNIAFINNNEINNSGGTIQTTGTGLVCASDNGTTNWGTLPTPPSCGYEGTITFTDRIELNAGSFDRATQNTNPIVSNGFVKISSNGNITNMADENIDGAGILTKNANDASLGTGEIIIEGNVVITDQLKLTNSPLTVKGSLTVIAGVTDITGSYVFSDANSPITVEGDILFNGSGTKSLSLQENISTTTDTGTITIQNSKGTDAIMGNTAVIIRKNVSTINGDITFQNNLGFTNNTGMYFGNVGTSYEVSSVNGTIAFIGNGSILNHGIIKTTGSGNLVFENANGPSSSNLAAISLEQDSSIKTEGSGNILIQNNTVGSFLVLELKNNSTLETTGSGNIVISDNRSTTNDCIFNNSGCTIRTTNGNISFDGNVSSMSGTSIVNEGTIETIGTGNIGFTNNDEINNDGTIQATGTGSICANDNGTVAWGTLSTPQPC